MNNKILTAAISTILILSFSCKKVQTYSVIPNLTFKEVAKLKDSNSKDTSLILKFNFTDGDGDIGLSQTDQSNDFSARISYKLNGIWLMDTVDYKYHIPYIVPEGRSNALKGELDIAITRTSLGFIPWDTIKFNCYILDRAQHQSNTVATDEIDLVK